MCRFAAIHSLGRGITNASRRTLTQGDAGQREGSSALQYGDAFSALHSSRMGVTGLFIGGKTEDASFDAHHDRVMRVRGRPHLFFSLQTLLDAHQSRVLRVRGRLHQISSLGHITSTTRYRERATHLPLFQRVVCCGSPTHNSGRNQPEGVPIHSSVW